MKYDFRFPHRHDRQSPMFSNPTRRIPSPNRPRNRSPDIRSRIEPEDHFRNRIESRFEPRNRSPPFRSQMDEPRMTFHQARSRSPRLRFDPPDLRNRSPEFDSRNRMRSRSPPRHNPDNIPPPRSFQNRMRSRSPEVDRSFQRSRFPDARRFPDSRFPDNRSDSDRRFEDFPPRTFRETRENERFSQSRSRASPSPPPPRPSQFEQISPIRENDARFRSVSRSSQNLESFRMDSPISRGSIKSADIGSRISADKRSRSPRSDIRSRLDRSRSPIVPEGIIFKF